MAGYPETKTEKHMLKLKAFVHFVFLYILEDISFGIWLIDWMGVTYLSVVF